MLGPQSRQAADASHCADGQPIEVHRGINAKQARSIHHIVDRLHVSFAPMSNTIPRCTDSTQYIMIDQSIDSDYLKECQHTLSTILRFCDMAHERLKAHPRAQLVLSCGPLPSMQAATAELLGYYLISQGSDVDQAHSLLRNFELGATP